jgi:hypothetical protein
MSYPDSVGEPQPWSWEMIVKILRSEAIIVPIIVVVCYFAFRGIEHVRDKIYELYGKRK